MERAFVNDESGKHQEKLVGLFQKLAKIRLKTRKLLTFFDWVKFCRHVSEVEEHKTKPS